MYYEERTTQRDKEEKEGIHTELNKSFILKKNREKVNKYL